MKKSNVITGLVYMLIGLVCLLVGLFTDTRLNSLMYGFAGAGLGPGILMLGKYYYWNQPEKREQYRQLLEQEQIELQDELKVKLRDKAGRYAYAIGLVLISVSIIVFSILGLLEVVENYRIIILYLGGYFLFQIVLGIAIFKQLLKKYE